MHKQDWGVVVTTQDTKPSASVTPGFPTNGSPPGTAPTVLDAAYLAVIIRELYAAVDQFTTPDRTDDEQLAGILAERISALFCDASDTGSVTTDHLRAVIASTTSQATGAEALAAASDDMLASGVNSAAIASDGNGSPQAVAALRSLVAACLSCGTAGSGGREAVIVGAELSSTTAAARAAFIAGALYATITGTRGAIIASEGTAGVAIGVTGTNSATIASLRTDGSTDAGAAQGLVAASEDSSISGGTEGAVIASEDGSITGGSQQALIAVSACQQRTSGQQSAMIASEGSYMSACGNVALIGSANAEVYNRTNGFGGGYNGSGISFSGADQNLTVWFDCSAGTGKATSGFSTGAADFAEWFQCLDTIEPGTPVALAGEHVTPCTLDDPDFIGVVSDTAGFVGNADGIDPRGAGWCVVGLMGQIRVRGSWPVGARLAGGRVRPMRAADSDGRQLCYVKP